ncbi:MAG: hypothetical protein E7595_02515 [Ruminococcaceae bacterium]|nr:hypothetical protein [Oscillospiraceae bacterium]
MQMLDPQIGLYVTLENDGCIKRNLITESGEQELPVTTIKDEIIEFSELNFGPYSKAVDIIQEIADSIKVEGKRKLSKEARGNYERLVSVIDTLINELKENHLIASLLTETMIEDTVPIFDDSIVSIEITKTMLPTLLRAIVDFNLFVNDTFYNIYTGNTIDEEGEHYFLSQIMLRQELTFEGEITARYFFRNLPDYYIFLLMQFLSAKPQIVRCECCGKYFVPKTNKATKYCDRVLKDGKTCKELAPSLKHKKMVLTDKVVEAFDRAKRKMYRRYERNDGKIYMSPKGITYDDFYVWNDTATEARDKYLKGTLTAEEALKIIEVND